MKIAISALTNDLAGRFHPCFGRAASFVFVDSKTRAWVAYPNPALTADHSAGVLAAQFIADQGVQVVISADYGPYASHKLAELDIQMFLGPSTANLTAAEILNVYQAEQLALVTTAAR